MTGWTPSSIDTTLIYWRVRCAVRHNTIPYSRNTHNSLRVCRCHSTATATVTVTVTCHFVSDFSKISQICPSLCCHHHHHQCSVVISQLTRRQNMQFNPASSFLPNPLPKSSQSHSQAQTPITFISPPLPLPPLFSFSANRR